MRVPAWQDPLYKEMYQQEAVGLYTTSDMEFI